MIAPANDSARRNGQTDPDAELMLRVREGNVAAFDELTVRYRRRVTSLITYLMGSDRFSEDLTQDVFLRVFRARASYVVSSKFTTWLFTIVNNVVSNARRWLATRREKSANWAPDSREDTIDYRGVGTLAEEPQQVVLRDETRRVVGSAVGELGDRQQTAVTLFYFQGLSYAAIADSMDTTQEAIKSLLQRARTNLRDLLTPYVANGNALFGGVN